MPSQLTRRCPSSLHRKIRSSRARRERGKRTRARRSLRLPRALKRRRVTVDVPWRRYWRIRPTARPASPDGAALLAPRMARPPAGSCQLACPTASRLIRRSLLWDRADSDTARWRSGCARSPQPGGKRRRLSRCSLNDPISHSMDRRRSRQCCRHASAITPTSSPARARYARARPSSTAQSSIARPTASTRSDIPGPTRPCRATAPARARDRSTPAPQWGTVHRGDTSHQGRSRAAWAIPARNPGLPDGRWPDGAGGVMNPKR